MKSYKIQIEPNNIQRELNAAINIKNMAVSSTVTCYEVRKGSVANAMVSVGAIAIKPQMLKFV